MDEIKKFDLHEFNKIIDECIYENTPKEKRYKSELSQSQKDMIEKHKKSIKGGKKNG